MRPAPQQRLVLLGEEAHRHDAQLAGADDAATSARGGRRSPRAGRCMPRSRGSEKPADVGVDHADDVAEVGERDGEVRGHRGLADAALARADREHGHGAGDRRRGRAVLGEPPGGVHEGGLGPGVEDAHLDGDLAHPVEAGRARRARRARGARAGGSHSIVSASVDGRGAVVADGRAAVTMPSVTTSAPSSGSTTPRRRSTTLASSSADTQRPYRRRRARPVSAGQARASGSVVGDARRSLRFCQRATSVASCDGA